MQMYKVVPITKKRVNCTKASHNLVVYTPSPYSLKLFILLTYTFFYKSKS